MSASDETWPPEDLESALTALLLNSLPEPQASELRTRIEADPKLREKYERLSHTLSVVREAVQTPVPSPGASVEPLQLAPERRARLLQAFKSAPKHRKKETARPLASYFKWLSADWTGAVGWATALVVTGFLAQWSVRTRSPASWAMENLGGSARSEVSEAAGFAGASWSRTNHVVAQPEALGEVAMVDGAADRSQSQGLRQRLSLAMDLPASSKPLGNAPQTLSVEAPPPPPSRFGLEQVKSVAQEGVKSTLDELGSASPTLRPTLNLSDAADKDRGEVALTSPQLAYRGAGFGGIEKPAMKTSSESKGKVLEAGRRLTASLADGESDILSKKMPLPPASKAFAFLPPEPGSSAVAGVDFAMLPSVPSSAGGRSGNHIDSIADDAQLPAVGEAGQSRDDRNGLLLREELADKKEVAGKDAPMGRSFRRDSKLARVEILAAQQKNEISEVRAMSDIERHPSVAKKLAAPTVTPEITTVENAFSTFSLNVADVSFQLANASLQGGTLPPAANIRTEEFINAMNYHDPEPTTGPLAFSFERARCSFLHNRDVLRLSVKTGALGRQAGRPLQLVLLLDNSGSMERADRVNIRRECLRVLAAQLTAQDRVSVITFARTPRLWIDAMPGNLATQLVARLSELTPEGGTHLESAMALGYQTAHRHFVPGGINRVALLTDGAANLGNVEGETLEKQVVSERQRGIAFDCFGIGWEGYNDHLLEQLSHHGDGRYAFVNTVEAADSEFAGQLAGALRVAASDVKVQIEFNPRRVQVWRQLGYARHQLTKQDFRNNAIDAAELGAAEAGNALYLVEVLPQGEGNLGVTRVRYKTPGTSDYHELSWAMPYDGPAPAVEKASPTLRLATTAGFFGELLAESPVAAGLKTESLLGVLGDVSSTFGSDPRVQQLTWMLRTTQSISGK